jgi:hypothetical protein
MNRAVENDVNGRAAHGEPSGEPSGALVKRAADPAHQSTGSAWLNANFSFRLKGRNGETITVDATVGVTIVGILALLAWLIP